jgi:hypothetical protein
VACGLYYLAELVEEYSSLAKRVLRDLILFVLVLHLLLGTFNWLSSELDLLGLQGDLCLTSFFFLICFYCVAIIDDFPVHLIILGLVSHATYFTLLKKFPIIAVTDVKFIASCVFAITSHILWFR